MSKTFVENQLGLYFTVGPAGEANEELCAKRQTQSYDALEKLFSERAMGLFGKADPTISEDFRYLPIEMCECEWESEEKDGKVSYSIWFHSTQAISQADAQALRGLTEEAYRAICGEDACFVRAEIYEKWALTERRPFTL